MEVPPSYGEANLLALENLKLDTRLVEFIKRFQFDVQLGPQVQINIVHENSTFSIRTQKKSELQVAVGHGKWDVVDSLLKDGAELDSELGLEIVCALLQMGNKGYTEYKELLKMIIEKVDINGSANVVTWTYDDSPWCDFSLQVNFENGKTSPPITIRSAKYMMELIDFAISKFAFCVYLSLKPEDDFWTLIQKGCNLCMFFK